VRDVVPVLALLVLLAVAYLHPPEWAEATAAVGCAAAAVATGRLSSEEVRAEVDRLLPVVLFLMAVLAVAECCRAAGLFAAIGSRLATAGTADRVFALAFAAAAVTTVVLSLDATVVLLTPVVLAAASVAGGSARALQVVCVRLANSASLLLPVSNLTNLLAMPRLHVGFTRFALLMAPVWLLTLVLEYAAHRAWFRGDVRPPALHESPPVAAPAPVPRAPLVVVTAMLVGFAVGSVVGVDPAWVAGAAAVVLGAMSIVCGRLTVGRVARSTHASFALFVLGLGVVVATLGRGPLGTRLGELVPGGGDLVDLLAVALLGAVLANLVNNLPAILLLLPLVAPLGVVPTLATLVGVNLGSSMTWSGSLANLLWRRTVTRSGGTVSSRDFHGVAIVATPVAIALGVVVLDGWARVV